MSETYLFKGMYLNEGIQIPLGELYPFSKKHFGDDFRQKYEELARRYLEILQDNGASDLEAIFSYLLRLKDEIKSHEATSKKALENAQKMVEAGSGGEIAQTVVASSSELSEEFSRVQHAINLRLTLIKRILHPYAANGEIRPISQLIEDLQAEYLFTDEDAFHLLRELLMEEEFISKNDASDYWLWMGTEQQLSYLLHQLKSSGLLKPHDYWKQSVRLFRNEYGASYKSATLRSVAGTLQYSSGGAPPTKGNAIDSIIQNLLNELDGVQRQG